MDPLRAAVAASTSAAAHKLCRERLPKAERDQAKAAIRLGAQDGQARLEKLAQWYEGDPEAAVSLREGIVSPSTAWVRRRRCILSADSCSYGQRFVPRFLQLGLAASTLRFPSVTSIGPGEYVATHK